MALQHILDAIVADGDKRIAELTAAHKQYVKELHDSSKQRLERKRTQIAEQRDQKMRQLKEKTMSGARMSASKALLARKQEYMDRLYAEALTSLSALPADKAEAFLTICLKQITANGTIRPAKAHAATIKKLLPAGCTLGESVDATGGFLFVSDKEEHDFTYEFLVGQLLRSSTEVQAAEMLFSAKD